LRHANAIAGGDTQLRDGSGNSVGKAIELADRNRAYSAVFVVLDDGG
jgi:hypothetical protein